MTNPSLPSLRCINTKLTQIGELFYSYSSPLLSYPPIYIIYIYIFFLTETRFLMCLCLIGVPEHLSHKRPLKWASFHIRDTKETSTMGSVYPQSQPSLPCQSHKTFPNRLSRSVCSLYSKEQCSSEKCVLINKVSK